MDVSGNCTAEYRLVGFKGTETEITKAKNLSLCSSRSLIKTRLNPVMYDVNSVRKRSRVLLNDSLNGRGINSDWMKTEAAGRFQKVDHTVITTGCGNFGRVIPNGVKRRSFTRNILTRDRKNKRPSGTLTAVSSVNPSHFIRADEGLTHEISARLSFLRW